MWSETQKEWLIKHQKELDSLSLDEIPRVVKFHSDDYWFRIKVFLAIALAKKLPLVQTQYLKHLKNIEVVFGKTPQTVCQGNRETLLATVNKLGLPYEIMGLYIGD